MTDKDLRNIRMPSGALLNRVRAAHSTRAEAAAVRDKAEAEAAAAKAAEEAKAAAKAAEAEAAKEAKKAAKLKAQPPVTVYKGPENPTFNLELDNEPAPQPAAQPAAPAASQAVEAPKPAEVKKTIKPAEPKKPIGTAAKALPELQPRPVAQAAEQAPAASVTQAAPQAAAPAAPVASQQPPSQQTPNRPIGQTAARLRQRVLPAKAGAYTKNLWLFLWIIIVIGAAQAALFINPLVGVYVVAVALASLLWLGIKFESARHLVISVALIPLTMLVSLSLPATTVFGRTTEVMVILLLLGLIYQYLFTTDYSVEGTRMHMTRHGYLFAIPLIVVLGQFLGLIGFGLLHNQYDFKDTMLPLVALGAVIFAIAEEIIFRGLIQQRAMVLFNPVIAAILSAALYAGMTFGHRGGLLSPAFGVLLGTVLAIVYYKKQNILLTISVNVAAKLTYVGLVAIFVLKG